MTMLGMPPIPGFHSINWKLQRNVASMQDPLSRTLQRKVRSGDVWSATLNAPPSQNDDADLLASWLDKAASGGNWFYASPPQNRFGGNWVPPELISNGTFLTGLTTGWIGGNGAVISVNARRLRVKTGGAIGTADFNVAVTDLNKPHVLIGDVETGYPSSGNASLWIRRQSDNIIEASISNVNSGRIVLLAYPSVAGEYIECRVETYANGDYAFFKNLSFCRCLTVNGGGQIGNRLAVKGGPANTNQALKAGQFVTVRVKNRWQMLRLVEDYDSDANGAGSLVFEPALRDVPIDGEAVILRNPFTRMYLPDHVSEDQISAPNFHGISIGALEDPTEQTGEIQSGLIWAWDCESLGLAPAIGTGTPIFTGQNGTFDGSNGLIQTAAANAPRFDYDPVTLAIKGLLIEEARTNNFLYSNDLTNAAWTKTGATTLNIANPAPDGGAMSFLREDTSNGTHFAAQTPSGLTAAGAYTQSAYVLYNGTRRYVWLQTNETSSNMAVQFDLLNGTISQAASGGTNWSSVSATISAKQNWGGYRITLSGTKTGTGQVTGNMYLGNAAGIASYTGDGSSGVYFWGNQIEPGAFATSIIPTTSAAVTRAADISTQALNGIAGFNTSEGTLVIESHPNPNPNASFYDVIASLESLTAVSLIRIAQGGGGGNFSVYGDVYAAGTQIVSVGGGSSPTNAIFKAAFGWAAANYGISLNGAAPALNTSAGAPPALDELRFGDRFGGAGEYAQAPIRRIRLYKKRLENTLLQALTS